MRYLFLAACLFACLPSDCSAQTQDFHSFRRLLFCNAYDYRHADSATVSFLKANFPYLAEPRVAGTVRPPVGTNTMRAIIPMRFRQHPFFPFKMKEGRIDFHVAIISPQFRFDRGADLWLLFENEQDAKAAFKVMTDTLAVLSKKKTMADNEGGRTVADFFDNEKISAYQLEVVLALDDKTHTYTIFIPDSLD